MSTGNNEATPNFEIAPPPNTGETAGEQHLEQAQPQETQKKAPQAQPPVPAFQLPDTSISSSPQTIVAVADDSSQLLSPITASLGANDSDLIEKEWVEKAKHIVAATQDDPFKQKNEISRAKADYIKKRFNKTVKVDDSAHA